MNEYTKEDEFLVFERNGDFRVIDGHTRAEGDLVGLEIANQFFSKENFYEFIVWIVRHESPKDIFS